MEAVASAKCRWAEVYDDLARHPVLVVIIQKRVYLEIQRRLKVYLEAVQNVNDVRPRLAKPGAGPWKLSLHRR